MILMIPKMNFLNLRLLRVTLYTGHKIVFDFVFLSSSLYLYNRLEAWR